MSRERNTTGVGKALTRADLAAAVYRLTGLPRAECAEIVEAVLSTISDAAVRGESVKISSFGTFATRNKKPRIGRNPKTLEEVPITARRVMTFKPARKLRTRVSGKSA